MRIIDMTESETDRDHAHIWFYQKLDDGSFKKISHKAMDRFWDGTAPLKPCKDGYVYTVEVVAFTRNRKPLHYRIHSSTRFIVDSNGHRIDDGIYRSWSVTQADRDVLDDVLVIRGVPRVN